MMFKVYQSDTQANAYGIIEVAPPRRVFISRDGLTHPRGDSAFIENNGTFVHLASTLKDAESFIKMQVLMDDL